MDQLPPELISLIVSFLDREAIGPFACVSRQWQVAVENITFRQVRLDSTDLDNFQQRLSIPHRRAALQSLNYFAFLPLYSEDRCAKVERRREREANNAAFTNAIVDLFTILSCWEQENKSVDGHSKGFSAAGRPMNLYLNALSPTDVMAPRLYEGMGWHRWERSFLTLLDPDAVPEVKRIAAFNVIGERASGYKWSGLDCKLRTLRASSVACIASKLPNLTSVEWDLEDCAFFEDTVRYKYRKDFADTLLSIKAPHLERFSLSFHLEDPQNDAFQVPPGTDPSTPAIDELSQSLHALLSRSPKLKHCHLRGPIALSPSLFSPPSPTSSSPQPVWPSLRTLTVHIGRTTPAGTWLYIRNPDNPDADASDGADDVARHSWSDAPSDSDAHTPPFPSDEGVDSDDSLWHETYHEHHARLATGQRPRRCFRTKVDPAALEPFVLAASRPVVRGGCMPLVERLEIQAGEGREDWDGGEEQERQIFWGCYADVEGRTTRRRVVVETRPSFWRAHPKWRPSEELRELWKEYVGEEGKVEMYLCEDLY